MTSCKLNVRPELLAISFAVQLLLNISFLKRCPIVYLLTTCLAGSQVLACRRGQWSTPVMVPGDSRSPVSLALLEVASQHLH